jgi:anti-sigma-K factor RskA
MRIRRDSRENGWRAVLAALAVVALATVTSACGSDDEARSEERPPVPVNVSVLLDDDGITASPTKFGAGPITLLIANQSGGSQTLTIEGPRLRRSVGPINPQDTATVRLRVQQGEHTLSASEAAGLREATLDVGPPRPSAQNELLLP